MASCLNLLGNTTIGNTTTTWGSLDHTALNNFLITSYLRPDIGGALLPWVYTIIVIIVHVPVAIVRVTRREIVQTWCIVSSLFTVVLYAQAYISTGFAADKILIWTPLILVIDASSMLQIFFLVIEAKPVFVRGRVFLFDPQEGETDARGSLLGRLRRWYGRRTSDPTTYLYPQTSSPKGSAQEKHQLEAIEPRQNQTIGDDIPRGPPPDRQLLETRSQDSEARSIDIKTRSASWASNTPTPHLWHDPAIYAALSSAVLFLAVIALQVMGLHAAATARTNHDIKASWCSPLFQSFGVAVTDGNCNVYAVDHSFSGTIGCILIPGLWQRQWLTGTVVGTTLTLIFEVADLTILSLVSGTRRLRGVKMKRPWTTMVCGLVVLGVTLFYGLQYASTLPPGITDRVTIAVNVNGTRAFDARLTSAGLRGTMIGWNDGLFESWRGMYTTTPSL